MRSSELPLKMLRNSALLIFVVSIIACELPLLLVLIGFGGLISADSVFLLSTTMQRVVYIAATLSLLVFLGLLLFRVGKKP